MKNGSLPKFFAWILRESPAIEGKKTALFEKILLLIHAKNPDEAFSKAEVYGKARERTYYNIHGDLVQWKFLKVMEVKQTLNMQEGDVTEVACEFFRDAECREKIIEEEEV